MTDDKKAGQDTGKDDGKGADDNVQVTNKDDGGTVDYKAKYEELQANVNKAAGSARKDGRGEGARERETEIAESLGVSIEEAQQIIQDHQAREEQNRSDAEKATKRAEKAEKKLAELEGAGEERDRYKKVVEDYANSQREGLPQAVQNLLDNLDPASQLEWLAENRADFITSDDGDDGDGDDGKTEQQRKLEERRQKRAEDTTPQDDNGTPLRGKARIAKLYSGR